MLDETVEQIHQPGLTDHATHCVRTFQAPTINDNRLVVAFSDIDYDAEKGAQASNGNRVATAKLKLTSKENYNGLLQLVFGIANPIPTAHILTRDITIVPVNDAPYDINDIAHRSIDEPEGKKHVFTDDLSAMDVDCRALENEYITASESEIPDPKHCFGEFTALSSSNNAVPVISGNTINLVTGQISATLTTSIDADYNGSPEIKTTITDGVGAAISDLHTISVEAKNDTPNIEIRKNGTSIAHNSTITIDEGEDYSLTLSTLRC